MRAWKPPCTSSRQGRWAEKKHFLQYVDTSVGDPWHFGADPDARIRSSD
jgi:hypothetical protein